MTSPLSPIAKTLTIAALLNSTVYAPTAAIAADANQLDLTAPIAAEGYAYLFPLVTMELARQASAQTPNQFIHDPELPDADDRDWPMPDFDMAYSMAWVDLRTEPMVLSLPQTDARYLSVAMVDMWSEAFASPGSRTTAGAAQTIVITGPNWPASRVAEIVAYQGLSADTRIITAPSSTFQVVSRMQSFGSDDATAVDALQSQMVLTPLSQWNQIAMVQPAVFSAPLTITPPPSHSLAPAAEQLDGATFFEIASDILLGHPPHATDHDMISRLQQIGFNAGDAFNFDDVDPMVQRAILAAPMQAQMDMATQLTQMGETINEWHIPSTGVGVFGNDYLQRAMVAQQMIGAPAPTDILAPIVFADGEGYPLDGANTYVIHFDHDQLPDTDAFWSLTAYDADGFAVDTDDDRASVASWMDLGFNADGSLDVLLQPASPGFATNNWLPVPEGPPP